MELTKPSGLVSQSVRPYVPPWCRHLPLRCRHRCRHPHWVSTPSLCRCRHQCQHQHFSGISVLSTYSYHPFISTTIYPKILSNLSCYINMERLNISVLFYTQLLSLICTILQTPQSIMYLIMIIILSCFIFHK